jgi:hypothetical protein
MTTKATTTPSATPTTGLRGARAEQAKAKAAATKTAVKPAPAKKAAAKAPAKKVEKATGPKRTYTATGRCGAVRTTQSTVVMSHAVDVADDSATSAKAKAGQIWGFFSSAEAAQKAADRAVAKGYDAKVVPAQLVTAEAVA